MLEVGGNEDQAIAGLLHDVVEDCGAVQLEIVRAQFGDAVASIVQDCTDGSAQEKSTDSTAAGRLASWRRRKLPYLAHVASGPDASRLVGGCDKLHAARARLKSTCK